MGNTATTPKNGPALRRGASTRKSVSSLRHSAPVKNDSAVKDFGVSTDGVPVKQITIKPELPEHLAKGPNAAVWKGVRALCELRGGPSGVVGAGQNRHHWKEEGNWLGSCRYRSWL